ncbi:S1 family peptidase [Rathayibacter toxicus]|uniref:S1 family peptidase n=1 Tax=Rathayibacter toxicus TaxID=145458 RepID=UPI001C053180|nr:S1 family peptidase [Rathayibacter toxicus]QWL30688.1 hypothetical protein E2R34_08065 [Rathayibacter toxicus]
MTAHVITRRPLTALLCLALLGTVIAGAAPAQAQAQIRDQFPVVAGTALETPGARQCTIGAILKSSSFPDLLIMYRRATRYAVIARHCINFVGDTVKVGGEDLGNVSFISRTDDIALIKIKPNTRRQPTCFSSSLGPRCAIASSSTPRAEGQVILGSPASPRLMRVRGTGVPTRDETFCTSGSVTGVNCTWRTTPTPPASDGFDPGEVAARTTSPALSVVFGDSGGPVLNTRGQLYGIIVRRGTDHLLGVAGYVPMSRVWATIGNYYNLA